MAKAKKRRTGVKAKPKAKRKTKRAAAPKKSSKKSAKKSSRKTKKTVQLSKAKKRPAARKAKPQGIVDRVSNAFQGVVDTVKETSALRDKMSPPGTGGENL
jgi:hypothetical protein